MMSSWQIKGHLVKTVLIRIYLRMVTLLLAKYRNNDGFPFVSWLFEPKINLKQFFTST